MGFYNPRPDKNIAVDVILKWAADLVTVAAVAFFIVTYIFFETDVVGSSMTPKLYDTQTVLVNKVTYCLKSPSRFDIIAYKTDFGSDTLGIKRIIGLPGETVLIKDGRIYIDGEELSDKYFDGSFDSGSASEEILVGKDEYFVMGDNRNLSEDSRFSYIGNISREDIIGKVWFVSSPLKNLGFVN